MSIYLELKFKNKIVFFHVPVVFAQVRGNVSIRLEEFLYVRNMFGKVFSWLKSNKKGCNTDFDRVKLS